MIIAARYVQEITNKNGDECTISTSWLPIAEDTQEKLIPLVEEIEMFVRGTRAQGKLWEDELEDDDDEGQLREEKKTKKKHGNDGNTH